MLKDEGDVCPRADVEFVRWQGRVAVENTFGEFAISFVLRPVGFVAGRIAVVLCTTEVDRETG